ncbi:MAG TPA: cytochrome C oxidase subunit IV family protein [Bacteroidales bacterium]|nr:cytochrome C oxidase subunit IV family protein [Bacteroidales bacterium]
MSDEKTHIIPYRTLAMILVALVILTLISVAVTRIQLGPYTVAAALLIAVVKSSLVLTIFMHLRFENRFFAFMVTGVILLIGIVIFITLIDYIYR